MRASRLLSIQMLLETRGSMSARALAEALEVSVRTLHRDVDQLSAAGVPIYAERGRHGGFRLMDGWRTTLTGLTPSEAQAVFLSGLAGPAADLGLAGDVQGAQLKLLAALPAPWRQQAQRVAAGLHLDPIDWYREAEPVPHLGTVAAAVWDERQLRLRYDSWKAVTNRTVDPLGLVLKAGAWYLVAAVGHSPGTRTYRISSILEAERLETAVQRPKGFDLATRWAESIRRFEAELYREQTTVLATPAGLKMLRQWNSAVARALSSPPRSRRPDGRLTLIIPIESVDLASGALMRMAPEVEVQQPAALRRAIAERADQVRRLYLG